MFLIQVISTFLLLFCYIKSFQPWLPPCQRGDWQHLEEVILILRGDSVYYALPTLISNGWMTFEDDEVHLCWISSQARAYPQWLQLDN